MNGKWRVKNGDGNIYGPVDTETLREWIRDDRVSAEDYISPESAENWKPAQSLSEFADLFVGAEAPAETRCQGCGKVYSASTVICTNCGTNLLTGRQLPTPGVRKSSRKPVVAVVIILLVLAGGYMLVRTGVMGSAVNKVRRVVTKTIRDSRTTEEGVETARTEEEPGKEISAVEEEVEKKKLEPSIKPVRPEAEKPKPKPIMEVKPKPDPALTAKLFEAMRVKDVGAVKKLVAKGANVNAKNKNGFSALYGAAYFKAWKMTEKQVAAGKKKAKQMVLILVENGARVNATTKHGWSVLHWATREGYTDVAGIILEKGADIDTKDHQGYTALHHAVHRHDLEMTKFLVDRGTNINVQDNKSQTPLQLAEEYAKTYGNEEMKKKSTVLAKYMREHGKKGPVVRLDKTGYKSLVSAVAGNRIDAVKYLIKKGVDLNETHQFCTPLYTAASNNYKDIAELLVDSGADVNAKGKNEETPLVGASQQNPYARDMMKFLIENGANVNVRSKHHLRTPLHDAVGKKDREMVKLLLSKGADPKAKTKDGQTPWHFAMWSYCRDIMKLLILSGADVNEKDPRRDSVPLLSAVHKKDTEIAKLLISRGANVNLRDWRGSTVLHIAVNNRYKDMVELLIASGADVNAKDKKGRTPYRSVAGYSYSKEKQEKDEFLRNTMEIQRILRAHGAKTE